MIKKFLKIVDHQGSLTCPQQSGIMLHSLFTLIFDVLTLEGLLTPQVPNPKSIFCCLSLTTQYVEVRLKLKPRLIQYIRSYPPQPEAVSSIRTLRMCHAAVM
jgi:hypothetical protein